MSIKLLNEKRMDELIQFIHQEEITKEYLKQNQKIIYVNENQNINGVIIFDVIKNEIELCLGTDEIKQQLIAVIKKIALKDIIYQNKIIQIKTKKQFKHYEEVYEFIHQQKDRVYSLDNFKKYMQEFYNIQHALKCIHVCGTNDDKVEHAVGIIKENSKKRVEKEPTVPPTEMGEFFTPIMVDVLVGGATVFVLDIEQFEKF